ncbi:MAG: hypothetical protein WA997_16850 [Anaerolineales bacterium]
MTPGGLGGSRRQDWNPVLLLDGGGWGMVIREILPSPKYGDQKVWGPRPKEPGGAGRFTPRRACRLTLSFGGYGKPPYGMRS